MTWAKIDDQFHAHRKAKRAWKRHPRALGLHLLAISYCAGHLTDGLVDDEFVEEKIPAARERKGATDALVAAGLWEREDDGWRINDWLDYNPSREDVMEKRRRDAERKATARARGVGADGHGESNGSPSGHRADSNGSPDALARGGPQAFPVPSRPTQEKEPPQPPASGGSTIFPSAPKSVNGKRQRDLTRHRTKEEAHRLAVRSFVAEHFPGEHPDSILNTAATLTRHGIEPTADRIREHLAAAREELEEMSA